MTKAARLQQFINLVVNAGCQDELSDEAVCRLALDLDHDAMFLFQDHQFTVVFSDRSRSTYDQVPSCQ